MSHVTRLALIIPVYNFAHGIAATLARLERWAQSMAAQGVALQVLFVDDGSTDATAARIEQFIGTGTGPWRLLRGGSNRGKGHAVRAGVAAAGDFQPDLIVFTDCDLYYGLDIIAARMLPLLEQADIVIVDRSLTRRDRAVPLRRRRASAVLNRLVAMLTGLHHRDTQAGLKGFRAAPCRALFEVLTLERFAFDVELLSVALHHQFRIEQVPVDDSQAGSAQESSVAMLSASLQMLGDLLRINRNWKRGRYDSDALRNRVADKVYAITHAEARP